MDNLVKRYIPRKVDDYLRSKKHFLVRWNRDLTSEILELDYDGLVFICDTILRVAGTRDLDQRDFVDIGSDCFFKILNNDYVYYLEYLIEEGIVQTDNQYIVGEKAKSYRINPDYITDDQLESILISQTLINKRTIKAIRAKSDLKIPTKHKENYLKSFKIDYESAIEHLYHCYFNGVPDHKGRILTKYTKDILQHKLLQIRDGQLWINRSLTNGRINSNLTTLNGDFKKFIIGYDYSLDIVSSQPTLLNLLIDIVKALQGKSDSNLSNLLSCSSYAFKLLVSVVGKEETIKISKEIKKLKLPSDVEVKNWKHLCQNGRLYEYFIDVIKEKMGQKLSRNEAKQIVLTTLYSQGRLDNDYKKMFNSTFPSIYQFLKQIKSMSKTKRSWRILPIILQALESYIWVENIIPELERLEIPHLFIHDSVIVKEADLEKTELKIVEIYWQFGIDAKVKIEALK
jgi:hypothetical protein